MLFPVAPTSITLSPKNATGVTGAVATKQFKATVLPENTMDKTVYWSLESDEVTISIYDSDNNVLDENKKVRLFSKKPTLYQRENKLKTAEYVLGESYVTGTYVGDATRARLKINGVFQSWGGDFSNGQFKYYVGADKLKKGNVVTVGNDGLASLPTTTKAVKVNIYGTTINELTDNAAWTITDPT